MKKLLIPALTAATLIINPNYISSCMHHENCNHEPKSHYKLNDFNEIPALTCYNTYDCNHSDAHHFNHFHHH